ncbi:MAG TPA: CHRD domain-containing protein, partial [Prosthecobacter sp.]|nr:CHRD domain-containing protein [Prosthecobacter sp.]
MSSATSGDAEPFVMRVRNVTATGFEYQVDEWDYLTGAHGAETAHFFALSVGTHVFGAQTWQVGRVTGVNRAAVSVPLSGFSATPVVLAQVETQVNQAGTDGTKALKTRIDSVTSTGFQVNLETQQSDAAAISNENIGYIAVSAGTGYMDGKILSAVRSGATVNEAFSTVTFPATRTNPIFVAQSQTKNDTEPGEIRVQSLTSTNVQVRFQEETSSSADVTHTAEVVGYIVLGDMSGETAAKVEVGDLNVTQSNATTWTTVTLANTYTTPVVVMGPLSYTNGTSLTVRVRNVTATSFEFIVDRWDHHSGQTHPYLEHLSYIVMESGSHAIGGVHWQAGRHTAVTPAGVTQALAAGFPSAPAVFAQVATTNDPQAVQARVSAVTTTGFTVELDESEIDATTHANEQVHWIAITQGSSNFFGNRMRFQAGSVTNQDSSFRTQTFSRMHADPFLFASMQTKNDVDPATLRWRYLFADKVDLVAQEDAHPAQPGEGTVSNTHSAETVSFLTVQGAADGDEDGAPDAWETSVGLNPSSAADGSLDPDADLLTNQQEYHNRLDFATSSIHNVFTGGVVTVGNAVTSGYEVNDKSAATPVSTQPRFRVSRNGGFAPITVNVTMAGTATTDTNRAPASSADYSAWTASTGGTQVTTSIALPANAQSVDIYIRPVIDTLNEYPEGLRLTAALNGSNYTLGTTTTTVVIIYDYMDIPANDKLFIGTFLPQSGTTTSASGFATLILNGPNNKARISTTFNGLTTPQTDIDGSHVHFIGGTIVYGEPDGLPNGQLVEYPWTIVDSAGYKGQRLIDALFRLNSEYLYVNVHTNRYAGGEIRAELTRVDSGPFVVPAAPPALENLANDEQVRRECVRFLTQATFGASDADVTA